MLLAAWCFLLDICCRGLKTSNGFFSLHETNRVPAEETVSDDPVSLCGTADVLIVVRCLDSSELKSYMLHPPKCFTATFTTVSLAFMFVQLP